MKTKTNLWVAPSCYVEFRIHCVIHGDKLKMKHLSKITHVLICFCPMIACLASVHTNYAQAQFVIGTPVNFGTVVNTNSNENHPVLSTDGLTLYFHSNRSDGLGKADIWRSERSALGSEWRAPENFSTVNTTAGEIAPFISIDDLTFLYDDGRVPGRLTLTTYQLTRDDSEADWSPRSPLPSPINDGVSNNNSPFMSRDGNTILFTSDREGGQGLEDLYEAARESLNQPWTVRNLGPNINSPVRESNPIMSSDGLTLVFGSLREGGQGGSDIWMSQRNSITDEWGIASNLGTSVNTAGYEQPSQLWEPGNLLLFKSGGTLFGQVPGLPGQGGADMFYVSVVPEPSTMAMSFSGVLLLMGYVRSRRG